jgi:hypothetical protein
MTMNFDNNKREAREDYYIDDEEEEDLAACEAGFCSMMMMEKVPFHPLVGSKAKPLVQHSISDPGIQKLLDNLIMKTSSFDCEYAGHLSQPVRSHPLP